MAANVVALICFPVCQAVSISDWSLTGTRMKLSSLLSSQAYPLFLFFSHSAELSSQYGSTCAVHIDDIVIHRQRFDPPLWDSGPYSPEHKAAWDISPVLRAAALQH